MWSVTPPGSTTACRWPWARRAALPEPPTDFLDTDAESGRGLFLMRALVDDFEFMREHDGTRLRLVKRWGYVEPPA
jgi:anti-sigma regulatory factor (Ser/Thr protein kinase)